MLPRYCILKTRGRPIGERYVHVVNGFETPEIVVERYRACICPLEVIVAYLNTRSGGYRNSEILFRRVIDLLLHLALEGTPHCDIRGENDQ